MNVYTFCCAYVFSSCILSTENETDAGAEREQAHIQCTALDDTPIEILWKINGKQIGEDTDPRCNSIMYIGLQLLYRFESWSYFKGRILFESV
jgi:hypothetical protein